jgi:hypothetical protein
MPYHFSTEGPKMTKRRRLVRKAVGTSSERVALRIQDLSPEMLEALAQTKMDARFDELNAFMDDDDIKP